MGRSDRDFDARQLLLLQPYAMMHAHLFKKDSPLVYFEGTYTNTYSSNTQTPRWDYNQVLYLVDLSLSPFNWTSSGASISKANVAEKSMNS